MAQEEAFDERHMTLSDAPRSDPDSSTEQSSDGDEEQDDEQYGYRVNYYTCSYGRKSISSIYIYSSDLRDEIKAILGANSSFTSDVWASSLSSETWFHELKKLVLHAAKQNPISEALGRLICDTKKIYRAEKTELEKLIKKRVITWPKISQLLEPGTELLRRTRFTESYFCSILEYCRRVMDGPDSRPHWLISSHYTGFDRDGNKARLNTQILIAEFSGEMNFAQLLCYPLKHHPEQEEIRKLVIERGRHCALLARPKFCFKSFHGIAFPPGDRPAGIRMSGPIVVDHHTFGEYVITPEGRPESPWEEATRGWENLSEVELLTCPAFLCGYHVARGQFAQFPVHCISDNIRIPPGSFYSEVLGMIPHRTVINTLAKAVLSRCRGSFSIGYSIAFCGPPGVGKTFIAKTLAAEYDVPLICPVFRSARDSEPVLARSLECGRRWNAVVLIDDYERYPPDVRVAVMNVLCPALDRHSGLIIITTTRWDTIDSAVQHRLSLAVKLNPLQTWSRLLLWGKLAGDEEKFTPQDLAQLARFRLTATQILKHWRIGKTIAMESRSPVAPYHVLMTFDAQCDPLEQSDEESSKHAADAFARKRNQRNPVLLQKATLQRSLVSVKDVGDDFTENDVEDGTEDPDKEYHYVEMD